VVDISEDQATGALSKAEIDQPESKQTVLKPPKPEKRSNGGLWLAIIFLLIVLLAGAGFYFLSQLRDKQEGLGGEVKSELTRQINDYQKQLTAIQSQISALQSEIAGKEDHFSKTLSDFSDLHSQKIETTRKELSDKVTQVQRQLGKTRGDWLVADAEYLLSVASERLHLVGDINTTREALEAADQRLRESGDSGVIKVREQIASEIAMVQKIQLADIIGLYGGIQALEAEVSKLDLFLPYAGKPLTPPEQVDNSEAISEDTNQIINTAIHQLEDIVTIKRSEKPIKEILSQEQAEFIKQQLKIKLEMLKIALVQQNDNLFQTTLDDTISWASQHFTADANYNNFIEQVKKLKSEKLRSQLPDISKSLKMLRDVTKLRLETDKALGDIEEVKPDSDEVTKNQVSPSPPTVNTEESKVPTTVTKP
jgi:uncharacterized protein HemX